MELHDVTELITRDGASLNVRRLVRGDEPSLCQFYSDLTPESRGFFLAHALNDATLAKVMVRSEKGDDLVLGLFDGPRMVGYFFLWYFQKRVPLLGIGLLDDFQGRGLGRPMLELLIEEGRKNGNEGIELTTQMGNERAFELYKKVGFEHYDDVDNLQGDGSIVTERAMFYRIKPDAQPMDEPHQPPV